MRFEHDGKQYEILFRRGKRIVNQKIQEKHAGRKFTRVKFIAASQYPYTNVNILEVDEKKPAIQWPIRYSASVGCLPTQDKFTLEGGRIAALRKLDTVLKDEGKVSKEFRSKLWAAYTDRHRAGKLSVKKLKDENTLLREKVKQLTDASMLLQTSLKALEDRITVH